MSSLLGTEAETRRAVVLKVEEEPSPFGRVLALVVLDKGEVVVKADPGRKEAGKRANNISRALLVILRPMLLCFALSAYCNMNERAEVCVLPERPTGLCEQLKTK